MMKMVDLPYLDEHATRIAVPVDDVWDALVENIDRSFSRFYVGGFAWVIGSPDREASGPRPLAEGSVVPGFRVVAAVPGSVLALQGRHRFSSYALIFHLEDLGSGRTRLCAETRAAFPGFAGSIYRLIVIGSGAHAVAVSGLLSELKRRSELRSRSGS
jgi:hypothetical protein